MSCRRHVNEKMKKHAKANGFLMEREIWKKKWWEERVCWAKIGLGDRGVTGPCPQGWDVHNKIEMCCASLCWVWWIPQAHRALRKAKDLGQDRQKGKSWRYLALFLKAFKGFLESDFQVTEITALTCTEIVFFSPHCNYWIFSFLIWPTPCTHHKFMQPFGCRMLHF